MYVVKWESSIIDLRIWDKLWVFFSTTMVVFRRSSLFCLLLQSNYKTIGDQNHFRVSLYAGTSPLLEVWCHSNVLLMFMTQFSIFFFLARVSDKR